MYLLFHFMPKRRGPCGVIPSETPSPLNFLPLAAGYLPEGAGRSGSGRGQRADGASGTRSGQDPRTARQPRGTATLAIAPTCIPERPGGAKGGGLIRFKAHQRQSDFNMAIWKYSTRPWLLCERGQAMIVGFWHHQQRPNICAHEADLKKKIKIK